MAAKTIDWLKDHGEATSRLIDTAHELLWLARSFGGTGNFHMEKVLTSLAESVSENTNAASVALSQSINEGYERSRAELAHTFDIVLEHALRPEQPK